MKSSTKTAAVLALLASAPALFLPTTASARESASPIAACLSAWGENPFGASPRFKTFGTSIKVLGVGRMAADTQPTHDPSLVLIEPSFNLMGGSTIELLNPNGWYCLRTAVSIMGNMNIRANCKAHLASTSAGATVLGDNSDNKNIRDLTVTSFGHVSVERPCN